MGIQVFFPLLVVDKPSHGPPFFYCVFVFSEFYFTPLDWENQEHKVKKIPSESLRNITFASYISLNNYNDVAYRTIALHWAE